MTARRTYACPTCKKSAEREGNSRFPFCTQRCRLIDLGRWIDEEYRVPGEPDTSGALGDPDAER
jgi:endogenous inhibitor of DNA gyrase (YacG/DUF329 family)